MLSYNDALVRILAVFSAEPTESPIPSRVVSLALEEARGRVLASHITAAHDLPPFDNSAVDGYAINLAASAMRPPGVVFSVSETIAAGSVPLRPLHGDEAMRILTGAPVPAGCDSIIMVEDTESIDNGARVLLKDAGSPSFIRRAGSDVHAGMLLVPFGTQLDAGVIGLLAASGWKEVFTITRPRVALFTTGDELVPHTTKRLPPGKIRDSNGPALAAAIAEAGGELVYRQHIPDDPAATEAAFDACADCDVIVTSGGVSVGDRDFVKKIAGERGQLDFWRVAIRPGKPLAFGKIGDALFFGLPGNPVSSLVTFELFVRPVLRKKAGHKDLLRPIVTATLTTNLPHEPGRREFVRATVTWQDGICLAAPTGAQGSHRLSSLIGANAYLIAHEEHSDYIAGEMLPAMLLI